MKFYGILFALILSAGTLFVTPAHATQSVVVISDTFHREVNGKFTDDSLGESISIIGDLYNKVSTADQSATWLIDPQIIEEIVDMSDGYRVLPDREGRYVAAAQSFLALLRATINEGQIYALPYGSPDTRTRKKVSEVELAQLQSISALRLARALDLPVSAGLPQGYTISKKTPTNRAKSAFFIIHKTLTKIGTITTDSEVAEVSLRANALLNPNLSRRQVQYLSILLKGTVDRLEKKVRVLPGTYTLTSTNEEIPITVVNNFAAPAEVVLILHAENARIVIDTAKKVRIDENSRKQVLITAKSVANGKVRVEARLETPKGARYGETNFLQFTISMIGPAITWVMVGAGTLLVFGSGLQIYRRAKRRVVS
jgi:hypothetical protein